MKTILVLDLEGTLVTTTTDTKLLKAGIKRAKYFIDEHKLEYFVICSYGLWRDRDVDYLRGKLIPELSKELGAGFAGAITVVDMMAREAEREIAIWESPQQFTRRRSKADAIRNWYLGSNLEPNTQIIVLDDRVEDQTVWDRTRNIIIDYVNVVSFNLDAVKEYGTHECAMESYKPARKDK